MAMFLGIIPKQKIKAIQLELTVAEAQTLEVVLGNISGSPSKSRRRFCDNIKRALDEANLPGASHSDITGLLSFITNYENGR